MRERPTEDGQNFVTAIEPHVHSWQARAGSGLRGGVLRRPARRQERWQIDEADVAGEARQDVREVLARIDAGETA